MPALSLGPLGWWTGISCSMLVEAVLVLVGRLATEAATETIAKQRGQELRSQIRCCLREELNLRQIRGWRAKRQRMLAAFP
mmetsp:Transcript_24504/g.50928  ORF Transcript_24504/g.50928 Transcript_24504/m.50928 type:complete len:81 (-) Transcript_24504:14-256(-)